MNDDVEPPSGLIIIARDATRQVITRLTCTRSRDVLVFDEVCLQRTPAQEGGSVRGSASLRDFDIDLPKPATGHHQPR